MRKYVKLAALAVLVTIQFTAYAKLDFVDKVRYIITHQEKLAWKELETEEEKQQFIEEFWAKRGQEFKKQYEVRVEEANKLFRGEGQPGWMTDRGEVFILLGPPNDRSEEPFRGESTGYTGDRTYSKIIWTYYNLPDKYDLDQQAKIEFVDRGNGRYVRRSKLDISPLSLITTSQGNIADPGSLNVPRSYTDMISEKTSLSVDTMGEMSEVQKEGSVSESSRTVSVNESEFKSKVLKADKAFAEIQYLQQVHYFKTIEEGMTNVVITIGVKPSANPITLEDGDLTVFARFSRDIDGGGDLEISEDSEDMAELEAFFGGGEEQKAEEKTKPVKTLEITEFSEYEGNTGADSDTYLLYQLSIPVEVDEWTLKTAVLDKKSGKLGTRTENLEVPSFDEMPALSSLVIAKERKEVAEEEQDKPFVILKNLVVPDIDQTYVKGRDDLVLYYQVYNEEVISENRAKYRPYDMKTSIYYRKGPNEQFKLVKDSSQMFTGKIQNIQGFRLEKDLLKLYYTGEYEIRITVYDSENRDKKSKKSVRYKVVEPAESDQ